MKGKPHTDIPTGRSCGVMYERNAPKYVKTNVPSLSPNVGTTYVPVAFGSGISFETNVSILRVCARTMFRCVRVCELDLRFETQKVSSVFLYTTICVYVWISEDLIRKNARTHTSFLYMIKQNESYLSTR